MEDENKDGRPAPPADLEAFQAFCRERASAASPREGGACPKCGGTGHHRVEKDGYDVVVRCSCQKRRHIKEAFERAGIPPLYWRATLQEQPEDDREPFRYYAKGDPLVRRRQKDVVEQCRSLLARYERAFVHKEEVEDLHGMILYGPSGRGKTRLACSILGDLIHQGFTSVRFMEYNELFKQIRFSFNSEAKMSYEGVFRDLIECKLLVIDDLGTEVSTNLVWVLDNIGYLLNERYTRRLPTIITCNYWQSLEEENEMRKQDARLSSTYERRSYERGDSEREEKVRVFQRMEESLSVRLRSRIREMCVEVKVEGFDYRERIHNKRKMQRDMSS